LEDNIEGKTKFRIAQGFFTKEYHLECHKLLSFATHSSQLNFKLLINYQNIMKMKQRTFVITEKKSPKNILLIKFTFFFVGTY
jgi:hypothetical protein